MEFDESRRFARLTRDKGIHTEGRQYSRIHVTAFDYEIDLGTIVPVTDLYYCPNANDDYETLQIDCLVLAKCKELDDTSCVSTTPPPLPLHQNKSSNKKDRYRN